MGKRKYDLKHYTSIIIKNQECKKEAIKIQQYLYNKKIRLPIKATPLNGERTIELQLTPVAASQNKEEAYELSVTRNKITIRAATTHGLFNALQTFNSYVGNEIHSAGHDFRILPGGIMVEVGGISVYETTETTDDIMAV